MPVANHTSRLGMVTGTKQENPVAFIGDFIHNQDATHLPHPVCHLLFVHRYDYHGECDLVTISSHNFNDTGFDMAIHARTKIRYDYSYIESAAVKIGDDILQVSAYGQYYLNGISGAEMPNIMADLYPVTYTALSDKEHMYDIALSEREHILIKSFKVRLYCRSLGTTLAWVAANSCCILDNPVSPIPLTLACFAHFLFSCFKTPLTGPCIHQAGTSYGCPF